MSASMGGGSDRATSSVEDDGALEEQPFLDTTDVHDEKQRLSKSWSTFQAGFLFFLLIVTLLALAALPLGFQPKTTPQSDHEHQAEHHEPDPSSSGVHQKEPIPSNSVIHHDESIPPVPQLRDPSEYILSPSWNLTDPPTTRVYNFTILAGQLNPDGVYRPMLLINNIFPGPLIECNAHDTLVIHVTNSAINATALHFHGLYQNGTNFMDGTVGVTQCAIAPNSSFTYRFDIGGQSGTYWYHAHHSAQASDGLLGPVVIHAPDERTVQGNIASDRVVMVQDHYHNLTSELLMDYLQPDRENDEPVPDNALINGRGVRSCADFPGWPCDDTNVSTPTFDLTAGQRHRLRIINVGAFAEFQIQFDEHPFAVTEVDGTEVHPEPFHRLNILPAQRYSVVLETNATTSTAFWMRARMVAHCFTTKNKYLKPEIRGIIRYASPNPQPPESEPTSKDWPEAIEVLCRDLNTSLLHPVVPISPPPANDFIYLRANFEIGAWRLARGFFNDSTWHANGTHPSLHRYLDSSPELSLPDTPFGTNDLTFDPKTELVVQTTGIRTVDISINNFDDGAHPFHLHGHKFFVLAQGNSGYPPAAAELPAYLEKHDLLKNPLRRDTVTVEGYAWAIIRVVLDNPGLWVFHCHNTWHAESGMVMQFLVRADIVREWKVDPKMRDMCKLEGVTKGMRPDDSIWFGQF